MRYFNWKLATLLALACGIVVVAAVGIRRWQKTDSAAKALEEGLTAYKNGQYEEAAGSLGRYVGVQPGNIPVLMKYADAQIKRRPPEMEQAIAAYRAVLRLDPGHAEAARQLAEFYIGANAAREAELICKRYLERAANAEIQRLYARALARLDEHELALAQLKALLDQDPNSVLTYQVLGQLAQRHPGKYTAPPDHWYDLAIEKNPTSALARIMRAHFYQTQGDNSRAIADLHAAQTMDLTAIGVRLKLAEEMIRVGLLDDVKHQLTVCREGDATDLQLWQLWAEYALQTRSKEKMQEIAQRGLASLGHDVQDFWPSAIELFIASEQYEKAAEWVAKVRQTDMSPRLGALASFWDGRIAKGSGQVYAAVAHWRRAIELGYAEPRVRLPLASLYAQLEDMPAALDQLLAVTTEYPDSLPARIALVKHYQEMNDYRNAHQEAQVALRLSPDNVMVQLLELETRANALAAQQDDVAWQDFADVIKQLQAYESNAQYAAYARQLHFDLALMCGEYDRAAAVLRETGSQKPGADFRTELNQARLYLGQQDTEHAVALLEAMTTKYADRSEPIRLLVSLFLRQEEPQKAIQTLARVYAGREGASKRELGLWLAELYQREDRSEAAMTLLTALQDEFPSDMDVKKHRLSLLLSQQDTTGAQAVVSDIKDIEGDEGKQWRYAQARVWLAEHDKRKHHRELLDLLQRSLKIYPKDKDFHLFLASAYEQVGDWELAVTYYREALDRAPDDLGVIMPMVNALQQAGDSEEADRLLARASERKLRHPALTRLKLVGDLKQKRYGPVAEAVENAFGRDPNNVQTGLLLVHLKVKQRRFAEAERLLGQLEKLDPESIEIASAYLDVYAGQGRFADMLSKSEQLVASQPTVRSYLLRAEAKTLSGQTEGATQDYDQAEQLDPNDIEVYISRGKFYQRIGQSEKAMEDINRALALSPQNVPARGLAIELLLSSPETAKQDEGRQRLEAALKETPGDPGLLFLRVQLLVREGTRPSLEAAEETLSRIVAKYPADERAWQLWTQLLLNRGQAGKALDVILRGLADRPDSKTLLLLKATVERQRSSVLALQTLKGLSVMFPRDTEIALRLASLYTENKDNRHAVELLERQFQSCRPAEKLDCGIALALVLYDDDQPQRAMTLLREMDQTPENAARVFRARTQIWLRHKMWAELRAGIQTWKERFPDDHTVLMDLASTLARDNDRNATVITETLLRAMLKRSPEWAEPGLLLGHLLYKTKRIDEAGQQYHNILEKDPNNLIALNNLAWFLCEEKQDYPRALSLANRGLKIEPKYVDLLDTRGTIFYRMGEFAKADEDFRRSIQLCPLTATTAVGSRFRLARVYAKMGRRGQAVQYLEESLKMYAQMHQSRGTAGLSEAECIEARQLLSELKKET